MATNVNSDRRSGPPVPPPRPSHLFLHSASSLHGGPSSFTSISALADANITITHNNIVVSGPPPPPLPLHHTISYAPSPLPANQQSAAPAPPPIPANLNSLLLARQLSPPSTSAASASSSLPPSPPAVAASLNDHGSAPAALLPSSSADSSLLTLQTGWLASSEAELGSAGLHSPSAGGGADASPTSVSYRAPPSIITYRQSFSHALSPSSAHSPAPASPSNHKQHTHSISLSQSGFSPFPLGPPSPSPSTPTPLPSEHQQLVRSVDGEAMDAGGDGLEDSSVRAELSQQQQTRHGSTADDDLVDNEGSAAFHDDESASHYSHTSSVVNSESGCGVLGIASPMLNTTTAAAASSLSASDSSSSLSSSAASNQSASIATSSSVSVAQSQSQSQSQSAHQRSSSHHRRRSSFRHHLYLDEEVPNETESGRLPIAEEESRNSFSSSSSTTSSQFSSSSNPYERLVDDTGEVKLASTLSLRETKLPNPFQGDWTPVPPPNVSVDVLVGCSLAQFNKPIRQVVRDMVAYGQYQPRKIRLLDYEVDEPVKARARLEQAREQQGGGGGGSAGGKARLQDLFQSPNSNSSNNNHNNSSSSSSGAQPTSNDSSPSADPSQFTFASSPTSTERTAASPSHNLSYGHSQSALRRFMDVEDGRYEDLGSAADLVDVSLLSVTLDDVQLAIRREQASSSREGLFWRFSPCYTYDPSSSADLTLVKRQSVNFWSSASQHACRFLVSVQSLRLSLGNIEPFYCTLAVFDLKTEERCSEDFHFDLNDPSLLTGQMAVEVSFPDPLTLCKHAIFSLTDGHTHEQTVLALRVERVLQGDPADMDIYFKSKVRTPAELHALSKKSRQNLIHLADYRQPFAWAMLPLFDSGGEMKAAHGGSVRMDRLYLQTDSLKDELFIGVMKEALPDGGRSKHKQFPASYFECRIDQLEPACMPPNRVDPSCIPLKNTPSLWPVQQLAETNIAADVVALNPAPHAALAQQQQPALSQAPHNKAAPTAATAAASSSMSVCKEVLDFTSSSLPIPADGFVNLLYVYPEFIKFENKYRNIACRVQVRSADSAVEAGEAHKIILGKSSTASFCSSALTQVNYHKRQVTPQDEIKVMLPLHLNTQFHLFFTFYKVSCKTKPGQKEVIGYSVLPLYPRHRLLPNDVYSLPIASKLPTRSYLVPYAEGRDDDSISFRDKGAKSFTVRIRVQSSIFNQDEPLHAFVSQFPNVKELHAVGAEKGRALCSKAVDHVSKADPLLAIRFMPSLADYMLDLLMARTASPLSQLFAFQALLAYMHRIAEYFNETHRCSLIIAYCTYRLDNDGVKGQPYQHIYRQPQPAAAAAPQSSPASSLPTPPSTGSSPSVSSTSSTSSSSSPSSSPSPPAALYPPVYSVLSRVWLAALTARDQLPSGNSSAFSFGRPVSTSNGIRPSLSSASSTAASAATSALASPSSSSPLERSLIVYSWFLFESMMKSLCMERCQLGQLQSQYAAEFLSNMRQLIDVLVVLVGKHRSVGVTVVRQLVNNLAAFLLDLFAVIDKSAVVELISRFLLPLRSVQHDPVLIEMKFAFHAILLDYPYYMDLCELRSLNIEEITQAAHDTAAAQHEVAMHGAASAANDMDDEPSADSSQQPTAASPSSPAPAGLSPPPLLSSPQVDRSVSGSSARSRPKEYRELLREGLLSRLRADYPLCALLVEDYIRHFSAKEAVIRDQVIDTLRLWLCKHDYDKRWRNAKPLLATMLFPLVPALCDEVDVLKGMEARTRRSVLMPFLWTLHHLPPAILSTYWGSEHAEEQVGLLTLLNLALHDFAYAGIKQREAEAASSVEAPLILAPETLEQLSSQAASSSRSGRAVPSMGVAGSMAAGGGAGSGVGTMSLRSSTVDYKTDIEAYMAGVHKTKTFGGSRSKLLTQPTSNATTSAPVQPAAAAPTAAAGLASTAAANAPSALHTQHRGSQQHYATVSGAATAGVSSPPSHPSVTASTPPPVPSAHTVSTNSIHAADKPTHPRGAHSHSIGGSSGSFNAPHLQASSSSPTLVGGSGSSAASPAVAVSLRQLRANLAAARTVNSSSYRSLSYKTYSGSSAMMMSREFTMRVVRFEGVLSRQVSRVVLAVTSRLLASFAAALPNSEQSFVEVLRVLHGFFSSPQPNTFLLSVYPCCMAFIQRYGSAVRDSSARQTEFNRLSNAIFRTLAFTHRGVRRQAVSLVYQLLVNEFVQAVDLTQLQTQFTMELSRLTDSLSLVNERCLQQTFLALTLLGDKYGLGRDEQRLQQAGSVADFRSKLSTLLGRLTTILGDSMEINRQIKLGPDADSATIEALLCQVADAFSHLPEVRIEWLIRLAKHHQQMEAYAEAGQCYLLTAQLAAHRKRERVQSLGSGSLSSEASAELEAMDKLIVSYYEACVSQLDLAELYEQCSDVYSALLPFYVHYHDYGRLSKAHLHLHAIFEKLIAANREQTRMLGTYYRVGFYGRRFGARLDGLELIYKTPKITRLSEIATRLKQLYAKQLTCTVRVLPDSNPVDRSKLDPDECVMQITFVHPHFPADDSQTDKDARSIQSNNTAYGLYDATFSPTSHELSLGSTLLTYSSPRPRASFIEQGTFITAFRFSTPFTSTGKAFGPVTEQQKRHTVLYVSNPFPAIVTAQPVVRRTETILSPIESATEDVLSRCQSLVEQVDSQHGTNAKSLTQLLQGSIATQVHGGAKEICMAFLPRPSERDSRESAAAAAAAASGALSSGGSTAEARETLRQALLSFLAACSRALEANRRLCTTDSEKEFQHNMDAMYEDMLLAMRPHLQPPSQHGRHRKQSQRQQPQHTRVGSTDESGGESQLTRPAEANNEAVLPQSGLGDAVDSKQQDGADEQRGDGNAASSVEQSAAS